MAAAYAGLVSLLNTMDHIQNHPHLSTSFDNYRFESLREKLDFFLDFVENYSDFVIREKVDFLVDSVENYPDAGGPEAEDLVRRIAVAAHDAENLIEIEAADRICAASIQQSPSFMADLQKIMQDMDSIKEKVIKVKEEIGIINSMPPSSSSAAAALPGTAKTSNMVGFDDYSMQLLEQLTGYPSCRKILPIVGMGGIGKTTLARNVYENLLTVEHFHVRAWVVVSQEFNAREIILQALSCLGGSTSKTDRTDDQLGEELYKILCGRRYMIVLDDVWSVEAWEKIMSFFPENDNRSRIVVTTRESELVDYFGSSAVAVKFLDDKNSWELFCEKTFAEKGCPHPELEQAGKMIVKKCKGLPLALILVGGLLRKAPTTLEYWEKIENDKILILDSEDGNKPLSILYLSYKHLPVRLKSCFLYLGLFPEDEMIDVPRLIKLWVAEGFIKSKTGQCLEEAAESYITELVDRNLLLVRDLRENKKLQTCYVHDLVRDLCIRIGEKENFYHVERDIDGTRHFIFDERTAAPIYRQNSHISEIKAPSILCPVILFNGQRTVPFKSRLLRVSLFDMGRQADSFRQLNLRFLFYDFPDGTRDFSLPSSISLLWSLQTIIIGSVFTVVAPTQIWEMPQLRHVKVWSLCLPDPPHRDDIIVLQNLQTLTRVENNFILSEEVCKRIPNIKELEIRYEFRKQGEASWCYYLHNVGCLDKLEVLRYFCVGYEYAGDSLRNLKLPSSIKELSLGGCNLEWSDMTMIASLPHLEILELFNDAVVGAEWDCAEEEFRCLKRLHIDRCSDLIYWIADRFNFPVLEALSLWFLRKLDEIPSGIGEILTLETVDMYDCSESASMSAVKMLEDQENSGNLGLRLNLDFWHDTDAEMWREKIQLQGFTCQNLGIYGVNVIPNDIDILQMAEDFAEIEGPRHKEEGRSAQNGKRWNGIKISLPRQD